MNFHDLKTRVIFIVKNYYPLIIGGIGMILIVYGLILSVGRSQPQDSLEFESAKDSVSSSSDKEKEIVVDVEGAVVKPGVYKLNSEARIQDLLIAASGLEAQADRHFVAKRINLAAKLSDGAKIYIPFIGESGESKTLGIQEEGLSGQGQVNINTASRKELDSLPGIGEVTAEKIINLRPYSALSELWEKKAVSLSVFEKIKDKITVY